MEAGRMLQKMLLLTINRHDGQFDRGGKPYILHCLKVMHYVKSDDEELMCIALGHDLIEDTCKDLFTGKELLKGHGFTDRIINGIACLTKQEGEPYEAYKERVKSNPDAVLVKMADLRHNSDIRRLKGVREKDIQRIQKYHEFYQELKTLDKE